MWLATSSLGKSALHEGGHTSFHKSFLRATIRSHPGIALRVSTRRCIFRFVRQVPTFSLHRESFLSCMVTAEDPINWFQAEAEICRVYLAQI